MPEPPPEEQGLDRTVMSNTGAIPAGFFSAGAVIDGDYTVLSFIGAGAAGQVYKVRHKILERDFALKIMLGTELNEQALMRFQNEAKVIAKLDHPSIVRVYNSGSHMGRVPYYVMDLIEGETLDNIIESKGPLPLLDTIDLFIAVCGALQAAHDKGIIHRDIKPSNIVLSRGTAAIGERVKVVDFGIAKLAGRAGAQALTGKGDIFGSPLYMSPEQCVGGRIDARSDIYSLGCTMFEAITGNPPFHGKNIVETFSMHQDAVPPRLSERAVGKKIPKALDELVDQLLEKLPDDRCQTMTQVAGILNIARNQLLGNSAQSVTRTLRLSAEDLKDLQKEPGHFIVPLGILLGLLVTVGVGIFLFTYHDPHKAPEPAAAVKKEEKVDGLGLGDITSGLQDLKDKHTGKEERGTSHQRIKIKPGQFYQGRLTVEGTVNEQYDFPLTDDGGELGYMISAGPANPNDPIDVASTVNNNYRIMRAVVRESLSLPIDVKFNFKPSEFARFNTAYMTGFRKTDISDLDLSNCKSNVNALVKQALDYFTTVRGFMLNDSCADDDTLAILEKGPLLENLELVNTKCTCEKLSRMRNISHLKRFASPPLNTSVGPLLSKITGNFTVKELFLDSALFTNEDMEHLARENSIIRIEFKNCKFDASALRSLSKLRHLTSLILTDSPLTPAEVAENIPTCLSLQKLIYQSEDMDEKKSIAGHDVLTKARPHLNVFVQKTPKTDDFKNALMDKDD